MSRRPPSATPTPDDAPESVEGADLSPRQRDVLDYISAALEQRGIPPTYREIGDALGIASTNGVADHMKALERKGYLRKVGDGAARGIQLTAKADPIRRGETVSVPLVGTVAAGMPILAEQNYEGSLHFDSSLFRNQGSIFALRVRGDSMVEEGILDGDVVLIRQVAQARNGDIVVALVDGEATVKFYFHEGGRIRLQPAHPTMRPIYVDATQQSAIQGVVIGLYRQY
jgi:repressor LexA